MVFHGLTDKFLTQEEKDDIALRYQTLKDDPTISIRDRNQVLVEGYWMALDRMNRIQKVKTSYPPPPSESTFKIEWISKAESSEENNNLYKWYLVDSQSKEEDISVWSAIADDAANDYETNES